MRRAVSSSSAAPPASPRSKVEDGHVRVAVRCRPMSSKEIRDGHKSIVEFENGNKVIVNNIGESPSDQLGTRSGERSNLAQVFDFDAVFDWNSSQAVVYETVCEPIVDSVLEGYNGTIFAYGQTGTGKTFTMEGSARRDSAKDQAAAAAARRSSSAKSQTNGGLSSASASASASASKQPVATAAAAADQDDRGESAKGVIPRAFKQIFDHIAERRDCQFLVSASYMEIYQEEIHDLLRKERSKQGLKLHERPDTGVYVKDLTWYVCKSVGEIERVMRVGNQNRKVGATDMNERSSRSHAIFMITVEQQQQQQPESDGQLISVKQSAAAATDKTKLRKGNATNLMGGESAAAAAAAAKRNVIRVGKLNLVDLAGSERQRKTNNSGQRHKESIKINLSLSALGNVINALKKAHQQQQQQQQQQSSKTTTGASASAAGRSADNFIPYRDSALTRLLQDSLGGNSRTLMIANIGPASYNYDETVNTLNYASRAKCIQNRPRLNEDPKDALLRRLQTEIEELRARLAAAAGGAGPGGLAKPAAAVAAAAAANGAGQRPSDSAVKRELLELKQKLASLEGKLLNSGAPQHQSLPAAAAEATAGATAAATTGELNQRLLQGYAQQQADQLERNRAELQDQANRERSIQDELERREEAELQVRQSFSSVRQEVEAKRNLVRQVLLRTKSVRDEFELKQGAYRLELDELDQLQYVLQRELRLKCLIMDNFIPNHHVNQLLPRMSYHEKPGACSIEPIDLPLDYCAPLDANSLSCRQYSDIWQPAAAAAAKPEAEASGSNSIRPRSEFERISETINPTDARYKYENLLELRVEQPRFERPKLWFATAAAAANREALNESNASYSPLPIKTAPSKIQSLIEAALNRHESDIVI